MSNIPVAKIKPHSAKSINDEDRVIIDRIKKHILNTLEGSNPGVTLTWVEALNLFIQSLETAVNG